MYCAIPKQALLFSFAIPSIFQYEKKYYLSVYLIHMEGFAMTKQKIFLGLAVLLGAALAVIVHLSQVKADGAVLSPRMETNSVKCDPGKSVCRVIKETLVFVTIKGEIVTITREVKEYGRSLGNQ